MLCLDFGYVCLCQVSSCMYNRFQVNSRNAKMNLTTQIFMHEFKALICVLCPLYQHRKSKQDTGYFCDSA